MTDTLNHTLAAPPLEDSTRAVHLGEIDWDDRDFHFRLEGAAVEREKFLVSDLAAAGQMFPGTLLEKEGGRFAIVDGFSRCKALLTLANTTGAPAVVQAHVIPPSETSRRVAFRHLCRANLKGDYAYGPVERARFFHFFLEQGLTIGEMAAASGHTPHEVEDYLEVASTPPEAAPLINASHLEPVYLAMLARRLHGWLTSSFSGNAIEILTLLLDKARQEPQTIKTWRFYLDFYWNGQRPFMAR